MTYQEQAAYDAKTAAETALPGAEEPTSRGVRTYREQADQHATEALMRPFSAEPKGR